MPTRIGSRSLLTAVLVTLLAFLAGAQSGGEGTEAPGAAAAPGPESSGTPGAPALAPAEIEQLSEQSSLAEAALIAEGDAALSERLRSIFAALAGLRQLEVEVEAGIVVLSGTTPTREEAEQAFAIAGKLDGVVLVVNEIDVEKSMAPRLRSSWQQVKNQLTSIVAYLPLLAAALVIIALAWLLARLLRDADSLYRMGGERALLQNLLRQTVFAVVLMAGIVAALRFLDAGAVIGTAVGAAGVVGLALGFAFRNIVENYLAGILLAIRAPFGVRDVVSIDGSVGTVLRMTTNETTLLDADGNHLRLPNAMVFNGKVLNYTRNPLRRFVVSVGVGNDVDLAPALKLGAEVLQGMRGVVEDPAPSALVVGLGDSTVLIEIYGWVNQREAGYGKVASEARRLVKLAFDEAGIAMPSPEFLVQLGGTGAGALPGDSAVGQAPRQSPKHASVDAQAPRTTSTAAPEQGDVSVADDVVEQVEAEIERSTDKNLLPEADQSGAR